MNIIVHSIFRISLRSNEIPKCTPICTDSLPIAPPHTDLELKEVIPISSPKERRNLTSYGNEHKPAYSGDRLVYQCKTDDWVKYFLLFSLEFNIYIFFITDIFFLY